MVAFFGFEVPFARWFQSEPWRSYVIDTLSPETIARQGVFDVGQVVGLRDTLLRDPEAEAEALSADQLRHRVWMFWCSRSGGSNSSANHR